MTYQTCKLMAISMLVTMFSSAFGQCPQTTPVITASGNHIICTGQSVTLYAPQATTYLWSNGETTSSVNISAGGNYSVVITDSNGCSFTSAPFSVQSYNVAPPQPVITSSLGFEFCEGLGNTTLSTTESYPFYLWNGTIYYAESIEAYRSGTYTLIVKNTQGCSASTSQVLAIKSNPQVVIQSDGPTTFCPGNTVNLSVNTGSSYLWNTGATTAAIPVNSSGDYSVTVTQLNGCTRDAFQSVTVQSLGETVINHYNGTTICGAYGFIDFEIADFNPALTYTWTGGVNTDYADYNYFYITSPGTYSVTAQDAFGCSTTTVINVAGTPGNPNEFGNNLWNVSVFSTGDFQDNGNSWVTDNYSGFYTEANVSFDTRDRWNSDYEAPSNASGYQGCAVGSDYHSWSAKRKGFPCGIYEISIPGHDDEAQLYIDGVLVWSHSDCCDSHLSVWKGDLNADSEVEYRVTEGDGGSFGAVLFTKTDLSAPDTIISSAGLGICVGQSTTLSVPDSMILPGTIIKWFKGSCTSTAVIGTGPSLVVSPTSNTVYIARAYGTCDISLCKSVSITVIKAVPTVPGSIIVSGGSAKVCPGNVRTYTTAYAPYVTWVWATPVGAQILNGQGTNTISVLYDSAFITSGILSVYKVNCYGSSGLRKITIYRNMPLTPSKITGPTTACADSEQNYSVINVLGMEYIWTSDVPDISYTAGQGYNAVTAAFGHSFNSGYIYVKATNTCGTSANRYLKVGSATAMPGAITGPSLGACGQTLEYSLPYISGIIYNWTLNGSTIPVVSGQGTNVVMVNFPTGITSSSLSVTASNRCTVSAARIKTISALPPQPEDITGSITPCEYSSYTYQINPVPTATSYTWTGPWGSTISDGVITSMYNSLTTTSNVVTINFTSIPFYSSITVRAINPCGNRLGRALTLSPCSIVDRTNDSEITNISDNSGLSVYPNPADDRITLSFPKAITSRMVLRISDTKGRVVLQKNMNDFAGVYQMPVDISALPAGTFILQVKGNGKKEIRKIIIR